MFGLRDVHHVDKGIVEALCCAIVVDVIVSEYFPLQFNMPYWSHYWTLVIIFMLHIFLKILIGRAFFYIFDLVCCEICTKKNKIRQFKADKRILALLADIFPSFSNQS